MKKKLLNFIHRLPLKAYIILAATLVFTFFSNDFGLSDVQKTAIVVAAAIDKGEEGYTLTAQIALPSGEKQTSGASPIEVHGSGNTLAECVAELYARTGRVPKFIFCDLLLLGEQVAAENVVSALDYFLRSEYLPDSCNLATCKGKAEELLTAESATDSFSSASITKLFSEAAEKSGRVCPTTLKDFAIEYYGASKSGHMPLVKASDFEEAAQKPQSQESAGGKEQTKKKVFSAEQTALFADGKMVGALNEAQTFAYNLAEGKVFAGSLSVDTDVGKQSVTILQNEGGVSLRTEPTLGATLKIRLKVDLNNRTAPSDISDIAKSVPSEQVIKRAEELLKTQANSLWERCKESDCDLFLLRRQLYRSAPKKYESYRNTLLDDCTFTVNIEVEQAR